MSRFKLMSAASPLILAAGLQSAFAADAGTFDLGKIDEITVTGVRDPINISQSKLSSEDMYKFDATTLDHAIDMIAGAMSSNLGTSRNEKLIFVHGFDRFQVPLSIDGIRVYLPADNRLDYGYFLTADLSEVQVQKGYVSVLDGPGGMGGAINLVTKKPTAPLQWEARGGLEFGNDGSYDGASGYVSLGSRQDKYYVQASAAATDITRFQLSDDFVPTASENGGFRDHSLNRNWRVNAKAGYTPNDTDEYSLSYTKQSGKKDAPFSVIDPIASQRDWTWPYWDIQSLYFLSNTAVSDNASVKTKLYYNTFTNGLFAYDNATYTTQSLPKAFRSYYDDYALGANVEGDINLAPQDVLKAAFIYRRDNHEEWETIYSPAFTEPHQVDLEDTYSFAAENRFHVTPQLDFVAGVSYDWRHLIKANDYIDPTATVPGAFVYYPLANGHAWNGQGALIYTLSDSGTVYANVSDRTRFPTIFDRFSTRFGGATSNPNLLPERAINYQIGATEVFGTTKVDASVFYSDVNNVIESVPFVFNGSATTQSQNVGKGRYYGIDLSIDTRLTETASAGLRWSNIKRDLHNVSIAGFQLTGVPNNQVFAYVTWDALPSLSLTPSLQAADSRWTTNTAGTSYFKTGNYVLANVEIDYHINAMADISLGGRNLFDRNYQLVAGFPEAGRNLFLNLRLRG